MRHLDRSSTLAVLPPSHLDQLHHLIPKGLITFTAVRSLSGRRKGRERVRLRLAQPSDWCRFRPELSYKRLVRPSRSDQRVIMPHEQQHQSAAGEHSLKLLAEKNIVLVPPDVLK